MGCVGNDQFASEMTAAAAGAGVNVRYMVDESTATGTCAVCIKDKERSLRLSTFLDAGILWGLGQGFAVSDIRYSTGFGLNWMSPIGPLKFSLGFPLRKQSGDEAQRFQFTIGTVM